MKYQVVLYAQDGSVIEAWLADELKTTKGRYSFHAYGGAGILNPPSCFLETDKFLTISGTVILTKIQ